MILIIFKILFFLILIKKSKHYFIWNNITIDENGDEIFFFTEWNSTNNSFLYYARAQKSNLITPFESKSIQHYLSWADFLNSTNIIYLGNKSFCFVCAENFPILTTKFFYEPNEIKTANLGSKWNDKVLTNYKCGVTYDNQYLYVGILYQNDDCLVFCNRISKTV